MRHRLLRLNPHFLKRRIALGILAESREAKALAKALRALQQQKLPLEHDEQVLLPPSLWTWLHHIPSTNLQVLYDFDVREVFAVTIRRKH